MYIHAITHNNKQAFAITEAQGTGGARAWGIWRKLRLIRFDVAAAEKVADELSKTGHRWEKSFEVLEDIEVDVENTAVNDNPNTHTPEEMQRIEEYKQAVDPELVVYYDAVKNGEQNLPPYPVAQVNRRMADTVLEQKLHLP